MQLTTEQEQKIEEYLEALKQDNIIATTDASLDVFDEKRMKALTDLREMITDFLNGNLSLLDFKEKSEKLCRQYPFWGFKSFSGQMQLNQYVNNIEDSAKEEVLKEAITLPKTIDEAVIKINSLAQYLKYLKVKSDNPKSIPRVNLSYLLSYFWELQQSEKFPVFFGKSKNVLEEIDFDFKGQETPGDEYRYFTDIYNAVISFLESKGIKEKHSVWFVEHILWNRFNKQSKSNEKVASSNKNTFKKADLDQAIELNWVPPIIADLEALAFNQETDWSKNKGVKPEKAFETKLRYAFTILGYEVEELGQGKGREPDGVAISLTEGHSGHYAIVYDAKAREKDYSIGTGDREIIEYIKNKQRELQKKRVNNISFLIVSSEFSDKSSLESALDDIYRATRVPVVLLRAKDLLYIVKQKLSNASIDHTQLEDLFIHTGILTKDKIVDILG